jgi:peptide chain release factor subunit 1
MATVTWETLRQLAGFKATKGCAISLYLGLDPREAPTAGDVDTRMSSLLTEGEKKSEGTSRGELSHAQRLALKADFNRIRDWFANDFDRDGVQGIGVFAAGLDGAWTPLALPRPVSDGVRVGRQFHLAPLVPLVRGGDGALVAAVGREKGELYRLRDGRLVPIADRTEEQPSQHDQGGWSQARFGRHIENLVLWHLKDVAEEVDRHVRRHHAPPVVLVASEEARARFTELLSQESRAALAGWAVAESHASAPELLAAVSPVIERWLARQETEVLERWREEAGRGGRASSGWEATLTAASDARVEVLLYQAGVNHEAWRCHSCGRAAVEGGPCPLDGTEMEHTSDGIDAAVHQTLAHGGTAFVVSRARDLDPVGGIGALLRF